MIFEQQTPRQFLENKQLNKLRFVGLLIKSSREQEQAYSGRSANGRAKGKALLPAQEECQGGDQAK